MKRPSERTARIKAALIRGVPVADVAKRYEVSTSYVYALRKSLPIAKTKKHAPNLPPVKVPTMPLQVSPSRSFWDRVFTVFRRG